MIATKSPDFLKTDSFILVGMLSPFTRFTTVINFSEHTFNKNTAGVLRSAGKSNRIQ
jgi:hypothetical protein